MSDTALGRSETTEGDGDPSPNYQTFARQLVAEYRRSPPSPWTPAELFRQFGRPLTSAYDDDAWLPQATHLRVARRLLEMASDMGVAIVVCDWETDTLCGLYLDEFALIGLHRSLRPFQVTATLGHELAHAAYRDQVSTVWNESRADAISAFITLDLAALRTGRMDRSSRVISRTRQQNECMSSLVGTLAAHRVEALTYAEDGLPTLRPRTRRGVQS